MKQKIVEIRNVYAQLNSSPTLENISLTIEENDFLAVIGPNGAGKTTLLKIILGLVKPNRGEVKLFGENPKKTRKLVGYLPQNTFFDPNFPITVKEVVQMGIYKGIAKKLSCEDKKAVSKALETLGIQHLRNRHIGELSGGELQKVFIARAIVRKPKLLLLDEPTISIDPETQRKLYQLLSKLREEMAIVIVTHDIGVIPSYVEKIACLNRKLFYHGPTEEALEKLEDVYQCPIELIAHGVPHRVLRSHKNDRDHKI